MNIGTNAKKIINNEIKIVQGLFTTDESKTFGGQVWELFSRFTWQAVQTSTGSAIALVANNLTMVDKVDHYGGATTVTYYGDWEAFAMGSYIHGGKELAADPKNSLFQHEYGHYLQSQEFGPFYLQRVGIPSIMSKEKYHNFHNVEQDANIRALNYFMNKRGSLTLKDWKKQDNPIIGFDWIDKPGYQNNNLSILKKRTRLNPFDLFMGSDIIVGGLINGLYYRPKKY